MNMLQVIRRGAEESARRPRCLPCPFCGSDPPLAACIAGRFVVGCDGDDCWAQPQVTGDDLEEAWSRWNRRAG